MGVHVGRAVHAFFKGGIWSSYPPQCTLVQGNGSVGIIFYWRKNEKAARHLVPRQIWRVGKMRIYGDIQEALVQNKETQYQEKSLEALK